MTTTQIRKWAASLGWTDLKKWTHSIPHPTGKLPPDLITWFECHLPNGAFLQINLRPRLQAAVYALKFRLFTGWHPISPQERVTRPTTDPLDRLRVKWFQTPAARARFRIRYAECAGFTWNKVSANQLRKR